MNPSTLDLLIQSIGGHIVFPNCILRDEKTLTEKLTK